MRDKLRAQRGVAAIEFAVVLPILLLIIAGIIEFSLIFFDKAMITNASRVGARIGIRSTDDPWSVTRTKILDAVDKYLRDQRSSGPVKSLFLRNLGNPGYTPITEMSPDPPTGSYSPGGTFTVTVKYDYTFLIFSFTNQTITLAGETTMGFE